MEKKVITEEMRAKLRSSFPDEAYSQHPTKTFLTTLKAMYITERLNDVLGIGRWFLKTEVAERTSDYITIKGVFYSLDYDIAPIEQYGGHVTTGKNTEIADGYKSAITDCTSKIASYLEIGIDMFKGKINPNSHKIKTQEIPQTNFEARDITIKEVSEKWNGKIYSGNSVFIDNVKIVVSKEQIEKLKNHDNYKPDEKK